MRSAGVESHLNVAQTRDVKVGHRDFFSCRVKNPMLSAVVESHLNVAQTRDVKVGHRDFLFVSR